MLVPDENIELYSVLYRCWFMVFILSRDANQFFKYVMDYFLLSSLMSFHIINKCQANIQYIWRFHPFLTCSSHHLGSWGIGLFITIHDYYFSNINNWNDFKCIIQKDFCIVKLLKTRRNIVIYVFKVVT